MKRIAWLIIAIIALAAMFIGALTAEEKKPMAKFQGEQLIHSQTSKNAEIFRDSSGIFYVQLTVRVNILDSELSGSSVISFDTGTPFEGKGAIVFDGNKLTQAELELIRNKIKLYQAEKGVK